MRSNVFLVYDVIVLTSLDFLEKITSDSAITNPDSKVHGANMGPTWVLSDPDEPHVGPMDLAIWEVFQVESY